MTDVFLSYAREDRDRIRRLRDGLQNLSWDVWLDPSDPHPDDVDQDAKLNGAGAVLVVWSATSRYSDHVRSEAALGLYRNKLIQVRIDAIAAPRPFDQSEAIDLSDWAGDRDDPAWVKLLAALKVYAGTPGAVRPQVVRAGKLQRPAYLEGRRVAWAPMAAVLSVAAGGYALWHYDPLHWRTPGPPKSETAEATPVSAPADASTELATAEAVEAEAAWANVARDDAGALRSYLIRYPSGAGAESARSLLRVLDAQAWVAAVDQDNEEAYLAYLAQFPADATFPGAMVADANARMASLTGERQQAIKDIQKSLADLKLYSGRIDGEAGNGTVDAVRAFTRRHSRTMINLSSSAPRDLRQFGDSIAAEARRAARTPAAAPAPAPAVASAAVAAADRRRQQEAQAAARAATQNATQVAAAAPTARPTSDTLAAAELERVTPPPREPFSVDGLPQDLRAAIESARQAQVSADRRAAQARTAAQRADTAASLARDGAAGTRAGSAADGDLYEGQVIDGAMTGLGVRTSRSFESSGDRYRGEVRNGAGAGLGVQEFAQNPNNAAAGALRYEGEHTSDAASGLGVTYWRNGDVFSGRDVEGERNGVLKFSNGQRYEGEMHNGTREGFGVVWSPSGEPVAAGRWRDGQLVEPATVETVAAALR